MKAINLLRLATAETGLRLFPWSPLCGSSYLFFTLRVLYFLLHHVAISASTDSRAPSIPQVSTSKEKKRRRREKEEEKKYVDMREGQSTMRYRIERILHLLFTISREHVSPFILAIQPV